MHKLTGFTAAGCLLFMALGCGVCALFSGGDIDPADMTGSLFNVMVVLRLLCALLAVGLMLAAVIVGALALSAKDTPKRRLTRAQLLQIYREQTRRQ